MDRLWWLSAVLAFLFLVFLVIPVTLRISFWHYQEKNCLEFQIKIWPGFKYRKNVPGIFGKIQAISREEPAPQGKETPLPKRVKKWLRFLKAALPSLRFLLHRTKLHRMRWHTQIGFSDAYSTALAVGLLWGVKGFLVSALYRLSAPRCLPDLAVVPEFRRPALAVALESTISVRPGYVLLTGLKLGYLYLRSFALRSLTY